MYFLVNVTYRQGLVRKFLVPSDLRALDFARATGRLGRIKQMQFPEGELDAAQAAYHEVTEGAIALDLRGERVPVSQQKEVARV